MGTFDFRITDPPAGAVKGRVVTVSGIAKSLPGPLPTHVLTGVRVQFGPGGPVVAATGAGQPGSWTASGALAPSTPDDSDVTLTATAFGKVLVHVDPDQEVPFEEPRTVSIHLEPHPPELTITAGFPTDVTPATLPYRAAVSGTSSGVLSGITEVRFAVEGGPSGLAINDPPGDWSAWHAELVLPETRNYPFAITAKDSHGRQATRSAAILVRERFENTDPAIVFGPTTYVRELGDFARQYVAVAGQSTGPDRAALAARFRQPFDRVHEADVYEAATTPIDQRRLALEVLRRYRKTKPPTTEEQRLRGIAYERALAELGTSVEELRRARVAPQPEREALAARLRILLGESRPDRLDDLTSGPDQITDTGLRNLFGLRSLREIDPFAPPPGLSNVQAWRQAYARRRWQLEDSADRDGAAGPLPVIDPDHVTADNLAAEAPTDRVRLVWTARRDLIATQVTRIDRVVADGGGSLATFDQLIRTYVGELDLPALAVRDAAGEDVTADIEPLRLALGAFRYLAGIRGLRAAGTMLLASEWTAVRDILVQVGKLRVFEAWRQEERAADVVLEPQGFRPDPPGSVPAPASWRTEGSDHQQWQRTLAARSTELDRLQIEARGLVDAVEAAVLPAARELLLAAIGADHDPPETPAATAERLTRVLCIDLLSDSDVLTTRADQAAQTLLEALVALRSGRLPVSAGANWSIASGHESLFDREWAWMRSYETWYSAITAFAYPENQLFPGLYLPNGLTLTPSVSYQQFLTDLRARRVTPQRARELAQANWDRMAPSLPAGLKDGVQGLLPLDETHTNQQLTALAATLKAHYTPANQQAIRELFWLMPVALGLALTETGEFTIALDWYQYAYAYQLPVAKRRIFPGLVAEHGVTSSYGRSTTWPADGTNPHEVAVSRRDAYTRFTVMTIVRCLLAYADSEYVRNTAAANARARALYEAALEEIRSADAAPETGPEIPFPANPVHASLETAARSNLDKIHRGLNIAAAVPDAPDGVSVLPSQYRYDVLIERAKALVSTAGQLEAAFLTAALQADAGAYADAQAAHDLEVARAMIDQADLKVTAAAIGVQQATAQRERAGIEADHYGRLMAAGANAHEREQLFDLGVARDLAAAGGVFGLLGSWSKNPLGGIGEALSGLSQAASLDAQIEGVKASLERQQEGWQLQQALAVKDLEIGRLQIAVADVQHRVALADRAVAGIQLAHAAATAEFLATKFTSTELFEWMSGVLNQVYAYFLRQATALARLAQAQLAFERQEPSFGVVRGDYWQGPPDAAGGDAPDRRGLTGSARLLEDIVRLDEYAFETNRRKLHLSQTLSLAQVAAAELQQFKRTGVLMFATPPQLFDRRFPGHYLRLIKRVRVSMIALVPPVTGLSATLSASGFSRVVVVDGPFATVTLRREPETIAFTTAGNATGLFELEPDNGMLLPFEGMGVDAVWRLDVPKAANTFDFRTVADVLLTIDYTALEDRTYRHTVIRSLDRRYSAERLLSVQSDFPDVWYELGNPESVGDPERRMHAILTLAREDFPPNVSELSVAQLTFFAVRAGAAADEVSVVSTRHTVDGDTSVAGPITTVGGIASTRRAGGEPWHPLLASDPIGTWDLQLEDTPRMRALLRDGTIQDLVLVLTLAGRTPEWP